MPAAKPRTPRRQTPDVQQQSQTPAPAADEFQSDYQQEQPVQQPDSTPADQDSDWTRMAELERWASTQVSSLGPKRARELIKQYNVNVKNAKPAPGK